MPAHTNPRKIYESGNGGAVSLPQSFLDATGLSLGDQVIIEEVEDGYLIKRVEWRAAGE